MSFPPLPKVICSMKDDQERRAIPSLKKGCLYVDSEALKWEAWEGVLTCCSKPAMEPATNLASE
jgi:hypothetical protein